ncbi:Txe/YoeB family addiction module toxin [Flavobacterium zhairuonense]|uniref:Txe/YoeB family addiction module toxin n=1 Tax=Flavobacterium zhairuonense TaxID=2493631 RepID=UPI00104571B3|nr:Txe/YoeB family addiction module toxin [Flavobacterium zhairuonense]KAF2515858.1 Txe/YoeB family addiction module toxin [Flavobacterium zhairuonense]
MQIIFTPKAKKDLDFWVKSGNKNILKKINALIEDIQLHPFNGIGKPEQLKYNLSGVWSRRIDQEHRLVYEIIDEDTIEILNLLSLKGHYE